MPTLADVAARLKRAHEDLTATGPPPGRAWCRAWTDAVDQALVALHSDAPHGGPVTVAAVGGYGRAELCPGSDVDLLLVHDGLAEATLEELVRAIVYPLWDAGLKVGYAVRSRKEAVAATDDLDTATAMLDARVLAGAPGLLQATRDEIMRRLTKRPARFLRALTDADTDRRARAGDAAEVLEPDMKSGAGGLRDVQSLRWAAAALLGESGLDPLVSAHYLGASDRTRLARAYEQLLRVRVALHLESGRGNDVLTLDRHDAVARRLGYTDDHAGTAAHRLLSDLFLAARTVDHVHRRAWTLLESDAARGRRLRRTTQSVVDGFEVVDGVLRLPAGVDLDEVALPTRLFAALADTGAVLDRTAAATLRRHLDRREEPWPWDRAARRRFVHTLWQGERALPALAELDDVGFLVAMIPEWAPLRGRAQRNPFHRFSLDRHAWHAAATLGELVRTEDWAAATLELVEDRDALMLGVLLHDVGKAYGEPHSETGIPVAQQIADRLGVDGTGQDLIGRLVAEHLRLPDTATRRDIADPALAEQVAAVVGDRQTLACLHLLAAADGKATGPGAWTTWKAVLVDRLVTKVRAVMDSTDPDEVADGAVVTATEAQRIAPDLGVDPADVRAHLAMLPSRYAGSVSPRSVVRHTAMASTPVAPTEVRTRVTPGADRDDELAPYDELERRRHRPTRTLREGRRCPRAARRVDRPGRGVHPGRRPGSRHVPRAAPRGRHRLVVGRRRGRHRRGGRRAVGAACPGGAPCRRRASQARPAPRGRNPGLHGRGRLGWGDGPRGPHPRPAWGALPDRVGARGARAGHRRRQGLHDGPRGPRRLLRPGRRR